MIVVTGAAGFIGSQLILELNRKGTTDVIAVDDFTNPNKSTNIIGTTISYRVSRDQFFSWVENFQDHKIDYFIHLGARTDTLETSNSIFQELNLDYSKKVWQLCSKQKIPLIYASSAATYGNGEVGYSENEHKTRQLKPLNAYAQSKHSFDLWVLEQKHQPPWWNGLKFFNVFGQNETHKGRMASMILQAYHQIQATGEVKLFKSYRKDFEHGNQQRDFVYVHDLIELILQLVSSNQGYGLLNAGTGVPNSFNKLVDCVFSSLKRTPVIKYIDMPIEIRDKYQYSTVADMSKCHSLGLLDQPTPFSEAIDEYIQFLLFSERSK